MAGQSRTLVGRDWQGVPRLGSGCPARFQEDLFVVFVIVVGMQCQAFGTPCLMRFEENTSGHPYEFAAGVLGVAAVSVRTRGRRT